MHGVVMTPHARCMRYHNGRMIRAALVDFKGNIY
jgi:hypothetical protein